MKIPVKNLLRKAAKWLLEKVGDEIEAEAKKKLGR